MSRGTLEIVAIQELKDAAMKTKHLDICTANFGPGHKHNRSLDFQDHIHP
jgi:hypothetical protein